MIKGAIIGLGKMGLSHAAIVGAHPKVDLVAVCDTSSLVLNAFNKFSKVKTYTDHQKMIDIEKPRFCGYCHTNQISLSYGKICIGKWSYMYFVKNLLLLTTGQGKELSRTCENERYW